MGLVAPDGRRGCYLLLLLLAACTARHKQQPAAYIAHVAVVVQHLPAAMEWYGKVLDMQLQGQVYEVVIGPHLLSAMAQSLFPVQQGDTVRIAQMKAANGLAVELFAFAPAGNSPALPDRKKSIVHWAVVTNSFSSLAARLDTLHATVLFKRTAPGSRPVIMVADPDGNIIELSSQSW